MNLEPVARPSSVNPVRAVRRARRALALSALVAVSLSACGGDDDGTASSTATSNATSTADAADPQPTDPALADYCAAAAELQNQEDFPTSAQLANYAALAPAEIADTVGVVAAAFESSGGDPSKLFADPDTLEAIGALEAFETEACGLGEARDPSVTEIDPDATQVPIAATDYAFDVDLPTEAGAYSFVMTNDGAEPHLMILLQLEEGASLDEVMASEGEAGVLQSFESNIATVGATAVVSADLTAGRWVLVCPLPDSKGVSHAEHGMVASFTIGG